MTHWKTFFAYDHLGVQDLPRDAQQNVLDMVVKIKSISVREVTGDKGKKDKKPVAELIGASKPMILNKTNLSRLEALFGTTEYEAYIGKPITLYKGRDKDFGGKGMVDCLRIRSELPELQLPALTPESPRWSGAMKAIQSGDTTIEAIKKSFSLTPENEKLLTDTK